MKGEQQMKFLLTLILIVIAFIGGCIKASEKIAAAVRLFDLMERADEEKVERGDL